MIYLVRHGQSEWNRLRRTQGQTAHPPLTDLGRQQASAAAAAILADLAHPGPAPRPVAVVVSSDFARATETARTIALVVSAPLRLDRRLREQGLGVFEGAGYDETFAAAAAVDWSDPDLRVGGGESARDVSERVAAALADIPAGTTTVVVSHGDAIRSIFGHLAGCQPGRAPWVDVPNGGVAALEAGRPPRWLVPALHGDCEAGTGPLSARRPEP